MNKKNLKNEKQNIIENTLKEIRSRYGNEAIMLLGNKEIVQAEVFSSGSYLLDKAIGIGGYPKGRIIEIYGPESSGKTTLTLHAIAEVQKKGGIAAFIDAEHSIDPQYAENLGINTDNLILSQPDSGEQALEIVDTLVKTGQIDLIVVDSVAALVPEAELDGEMRDQNIGLQARMMSKALRKITGNLNRNQTTVIFINQVRSKIGVVYGDPETTPGGRALKFYASLRLDVRKSTKVLSKDEVTGNLIKIKVVKNKLAPPYKAVETEIVFGKGVNITGEVINLATLYGIIKKAGAWFSYKDVNLAQGKTNLVKHLEEKVDLYAEILQAVKDFEQKNSAKNLEKAIVIEEAENEVAK
ncbi:recombinase RecA [Mycoplasmopsis agassizii]|uniref:Protein RecA n=1 Tax=Mycoplasmopsis agassizii TaxID=33922 RepID=A0A269TJN7_9BACT|nr:recombinase RecA [Mycoplasmopsis agassizii]PAK21597.1 recombinase RecA [Mycoplasmopsis agassizii]